MTQLSKHMANHPKKKPKKKKKRKENEVELSGLSLFISNQQSNVKYTTTKHNKKNIQMHIKMLSQLFKLTKTPSVIKNRQSTQKKSEY